MSLIKLPKLKIDESSIKEKVPLNLSSTRNLSINCIFNIFKILQRFFQLKYILPKSKLIIHMSLVFQLKI